MLTLALATKAATFERLQSPLEDRGIEMRHLRTREQAIDLEEPPWSGDDFDVGFVFPPRLMEGGTANAVVDLPWVNDREAVLTSRNKAAVLAQCARAGLPVPETTYVSNPVDDDVIAAAVDAIGPPVVIKPNSATRGVGGARVGDVDSALGVTDYLDLVHDFQATGDRSYLIQEYLPGATDYRAMVVDGEYAGAVERRPPSNAARNGAWKHNVHRGAEAVSVDLDSELRGLAETVAAELSIPFLGVDLLVNDDRVVVSETNARPTVDDATKYEPGFHDRVAKLIRSTAGEE